MISENDYFPFGWVGDRLAWGGSPTNNFLTVEMTRLDKFLNKSVIDLGW